MGFFSWIKSLPGKVVNTFKDISGKINDVGRQIVGKVSGGLDFVRNTANKIGSMPVIGDVLSNIAAVNPTIQKVVGTFNRVDDTVKDTAKRIWGEAPALSTAPPLPMAST
jgi:phage-related protein